MRRKRKKIRHLSQEEKTYIETPKDFVGYAKQIKMYNTLRIAIQILVNRKFGDTVKETLETMTRYKRTKHYHRQWLEDWNRYINSKLKKYTLKEIIEDDKII